MADDYCYLYANDSQGAQIRPKFAKGHLPLAERPSTDNIVTAQSTLQILGYRGLKANSGNGMSCPRLDRMAQRHEASM
jgi:hypothetical protein